MKLKHTPGPWEISWNTFNSGEEHGIYANGELDLKGWQIAKVNYFPTMDSHVTEETGKYNAKLIAAAPDLLDSAMYAIECLDRLNEELGQIGDNGDQAYNALKSAIEKATK